MKKRNILMMMTLTLFVSFLFLFSIQSSVATNMIVLNMSNGSNFSANNGSGTLVTFNIAYSNSTDTHSQPANATIFYNGSDGSTTEWLALGNFSCSVATTSNNTCSGTLNISKNASGATILGLNKVTLNATLYNSTGSVLNGSNFTSLAKAVFTIDNQGPNVTWFNISNDLLDGLNYTSSILRLNVTVNDSIFPIAYSGQNISVYFNFTNDATAVINLSLNGNMTVDNQYSRFFNTSHIVDGTYTISVWANDSLGNWNSSTTRASFTVDRTAPVITLTIDDTLTTKDTLVFGISIADTTGSVATCSTDRDGDTVTKVGTGNTQTITETGLSCGTSYSYKVTCSDILAFSTTTSPTAFSTDSCSSSSAGGGGGGSGGTTVQIITSGNPITVKESQIESSSGYRAKFQKDGEIKFDITSSASSSVVQHSLTVTRVGGNSVTIIVASDPITLSINVGDEKKVDVDGDGVFDISIRLNGISSGRADISVEKIEVASDSGESVSEGEEISPGDRIKGADAKGGEGEEDEGRSLTVVWVILIVVIVAVVAGIIYQKKKR